LNPGDLISGKYRLQCLLGSGGMGSVWAARNELTERDFAIKFLLPGLSGNQDALHRFFVEARASGRIKHPAVVEVYDVGQADDGSPFLVMELLKGEGLDQRLARAGRLAPVDAALYLSFVARGLQEAHARGVVHRDLKPGNVFLSIDALGEVVPKILDFGVSKATNLRSNHFTTTAGVVLGSPAYMSPEQARGDTELDGRSDVWALGVILYQSLTGNVPFEAPNYNALMVKIMSGPHLAVRELAPDVPTALSALVERALVKDKFQRIGSAREFAEHLEALLDALHVERRRSLVVKTPAAGLSAAPPPSSAPLPTGRLGRARAWLTLTRVIGLLTAALLVAGAGTFVQQLSRPRVLVASGAARPLAALVSRLKAAANEAQAKPFVEEEPGATRRPETPPALPPSPTSRRAQPTPKDRQHNPHGGVESPGF
jgi:eukaryotic-like serine/threonine-protein kinase